MQTITYKVEGETPLIMHNDTLSNPLNPLSEEMKELTKKRNKTREDYLKIAKLEFMASLYWDEKKGYIMPAKNLSATMFGSAKQFKQGTQWKQGAMIAEDAVFEFQNSKLSQEDLFEVPEHVDMRGVKVNNSKITRCRPIFPKWSLKFSVYFDEGKFNAKEITNIVSNAGKYIGLCDFRPMYGRFNSSIIKN